MEWNSMTEKHQLKNLMFDYASLFLETILAIHAALN